MDIRSIKMNENIVDRIMKLAKISGVSIALFDSDQVLHAKVLGVDHKSKHSLTINSIFRCASLTKPLFAYLVLKLIIDNQTDKAKPGFGKFKLPNNLKEFTLDTPLHEIVPSLLEKFDKKDIEEAKKITARHVLTHQTGLPINKRSKKLRFLFEPGTQFGYSNPGILLLQEVIEKLTDTNLQRLAQEKIFTPFHMNHSHFYGYSHVIMSDKEATLTDVGHGNFIMLKEDGQLTAYWNEDGKLLNRSFREDEPAVQEIIKMLPQVGDAIDNIALIKAIIEKYNPAKAICAANSLHTTASDYAKFMTGWVTEKELKGNEILKEAFECPKEAKHDAWAVNQKMTEEERKRTAWGTGLGLQLSDDGETVTCAFHSGDMDDWRAFFAIDMIDKNHKGIVLLSNSPAATLLYKDILLPNVGIGNALSNFFKKWGFASELETGWQSKEIDRACQIILKNEFDLVGALENKLIKIDNNKVLHTLTICCDEDHSLLNFAIKREFDRFAENNENVLYSVKEGQGYDLCLMSKNDFDQLADDLKTKPYLLKTQDNKYILWGYKEEKWQPTEMEDDFKIPPEWRNKGNVFVSTKHETYSSLSEGHTPQDGNVNFLEIGIHDNNLYDQFINILKAKEFLPEPKQPAQKQQVTNYKSPMSTIGNQ